VADNPDRGSLGLGPAAAVVIFLVSGEYNLATVSIAGRAEFGEYGLAIVYSAVLIVIIAVAPMLFQALVGERRIGRRAPHPSQGNW
jgi:iron(III) transport system permease protein